MSAQPPAEKQSAKNPGRPVRTARRPAWLRGCANAAGGSRLELDDGEQRLEVSLFHDSLRSLPAPADAGIDRRGITGKIRYDDFIGGWRLNGESK